MITPPPPEGWTRWEEIPTVMQDGQSQDVEWRCLERTLAQFTEAPGLELTPDFQRGHVWTTEQRIAYLEAKARRSIGHGVDLIRFSTRNWMRSSADPDTPLLLVDGLQRITTARMFLADELPMFGRFYSQIQGPMRLYWSFRFIINEGLSHEDAIRWYLELNAGGTPHDPAEIARVRTLLEAP